MAFHLTRAQATLSGVRSGVGAPRLVPALVKSGAGGAICHDADPAPSSPAASKSMASADAEADAGTDSDANTDSDTDTDTNANAEASSTWVNSI